MQTARRFGAFCALALLAALAATSPSNAGCPGLPSGIDVYPSTAKLVVDDNVFGQPFVVRLSSANQTDTVVERDAQSGDAIDTEIVQLQLAGFHPRIGSVALRQSPAAPSFGQIADVVLDGSCELIGGHAVYDVFFELDVPSSGEIWINQDPVRIEAELTGLAPDDVVYEVPFTHSVALFEKDTLEDRGEILYLMHHADPTLPAPGRDCFESLLTADLEVFSESTTVSLIGFGSTTVERGPVSTGGYCKQGGGPCDDNFDCLLLDTCVQQNVETEIVAMDLAGFDALLGSWAVHARPVTGDSDCCEEHVTPGCSDPACESLICAMDSYCCETEWDELCADLAKAEPECEIGCFDPNAAASTGRIESLESTATYPAVSAFDVFERIETSQQGDFLNQQKIPVGPADPVTNFPSDPNTDYRYLGSPVSMFTPEGAPAGEISNVHHTLQIPVDCAPPVGAGEACVLSRFEIELDLPPCPPETVLLDGSLRVLRDDPVDPSGLGHEVIDTTVANGSFSGNGACNGAVSLRFSPTDASSGSTSSLTPEEFHPADSFFDAFVEIDAPAGTFHAGPIRLSTTLNAFPPEADEIYFGAGSSVDLLNDLDAKVGEVLRLDQEILHAVACGPEGRSEIVFPGPARSDIDVRIPQGGGGVEYDVVRGDLNDLRSTSGGFGSTTCIGTDVPPALTDTETPPAGDGFFYVAREGFRAFNGTWNGTGAGQAADRDGEIASCP